MLYSHPPFYIDSHNVCVFIKIQCHTHTPTNTHQATAQVYPPQSVLWLWEQQRNTSLLYKQVGPLVPLTLLSSSQSSLERNTVSTDKFPFN